MKMPIQLFPERILRSKFTKMKMPIQLLPEQILRSNFTKIKMPLHSLPEKILITKFYKTECQYTHCQNEFSEQILQNENATTLIARTNSQN